ncbi:MAG TPA: hypothetical protein VK699_03510 [Terriglobales bacterium]|jgi:hypothetical protein|nr:hypothetical protein [Terriglobales bacterium]
MQSEHQHLTAIDLDGYRQRKLDAAARQECDRHFAICEECLGRLLGDKQSRAVFSQLKEAFVSSDAEPFHLSLEELRSYATDTADEATRTICESHFEICPQCVRELKTFAPSRASAPLRGQAAAKPQYPGKWLPQAGRGPGLLTARRLAGVFSLAACLLLIWAAWRNVSSLQESAHSHRETSQIVVRLKDGTQEITLDRSGSLTGLEGLSQQAQAEVRDALATAELQRPQSIAGLSAPPIKLLGAPANAPPFDLVSPIATVVAEEQPTLRWKPLRGATSYTISVFDATFNQVAKSGAVSALEWSVPVPLQRGSTYSWQVTARRDHQQITVPSAPAPRAQFKLLNVEEIKQLNSAKEQAANSHLALGVLYARAGLLDEAEKQFQALVEQNPQSSVAGKLFQTVQSWRKK